MVEYLDGRYFELALSTYYGKKYVKYSPVNVNIFIKSRKINIETDISEKIKKLKNTDINILRLIIQIFKISKEHDDIEMISRHSNALIIDNNNKTIIRFEPNNNNKYDDKINDVIFDSFSELIKYNNYNYYEWDYHPQKDISDKGLCVGYVLKFSIDYMDNVKYIKYNDDIINKFIHNLKIEFGELSEDNPDIEFGMGEFFYIIVPMHIIRYFKPNFLRGSLFEMSAYIYNNYYIENKVIKNIENTDEKEYVRNKYREQYLRKALINTALISILGSPYLIAKIFMSASILYNRNTSISEYKIAKYKVSDNKTQKFIKLIGTDEYIPEYKVNLGQTIHIPNK